MTPSAQSAPKPDQIRQRLPTRYSWIDHAAKLPLQNVPSTGQALYLILLLIGNRHGLSYHGEASLRALTKLDHWQLMWGNAMNGGASFTFGSGAL